MRGVPYREADLVATFFTESEGILGAIVRGARTSTKRFGGALEPIHELVVVLEDRGEELGVLREARVTTPRTGIVTSLSGMENAGQALRWVRHLLPARTPEPVVFGELRSLFGAFDAEPTADDANTVRLAAFGLRALTNLGYGLEFERCARCGRACPEGRSAYVDAKNGGLVCSNCGGARKTIGPDVRSLARRVQHMPRDAYAELGRVAEEVAAEAKVAKTLLALVEEAMTAHTDYRTAPASSSR